MNLKLRGRNRGEVRKDLLASNLQYLTNESRNKPSDVEIFGDVLMAGQFSTSDEWTLVASSYSAQDFVQSHP